MAPQADGLLVHSHLVRVDGGLHQDPLLVDGGALQHLLHPGGELGAVLRLRSHVAQLRTMLASDEPMGRKMDFLIQEVNRESNTIGSKCNDVAIANVVVGLKAEVEKMREQVQNVE